MRRFTLFLALLLAAVAWWAKDEMPLWPTLWPGQAPTVYYPASQFLPDIIPPSGPLAEIFEAARGATLRIEARVPGTPVPIGIGTGFFFSGDGLVLTAFHVVDKSELREAVRNRVSYVGVTPDEVSYPLELLGFDAYLDLAVLRASAPAGVPFLPLALVAPTVDSEILAIGNSRGDFLQGRTGRVSRLSVASPRARFASGTIELTASLSPGDSGGPVLNDSGEAFGVVSYISFNPSAVDPPPYLRGVIRPGFASYAVPVTTSSEILSALIAGRRNDIPVIGLRLDDYSASAMNGSLGRRSGALVREVQPDGPAALAGIRSSVLENGSVRAADVIIAVDDERISSAERLIDVIYRKQVGQTVTVTVQRADQTFSVRLTLGAKQDVFN